jgi:hypothetical protein
MFGGVIEYIIMGRIKQESIWPRYSPTNEISLPMYQYFPGFPPLDSFEDLVSPPSSVLAVMKNRWLSNSFKVAEPTH